MWFIAQVSMKNKLVKFFYQYVVLKGAKALNAITILDTWKNTDILDMFDDKRLFEQQAHLRQS